MTDDKNARALLTLAAELPDDVQAPVLRLVERGRSRRRLRAAASALTACGLVAAAITGAAVVSTADRPIGPPARRAEGPPTPPPGPTATQLARFHWSTLPASPLRYRLDPVLTWTGHELLEIGGINGPTGQPTRDGAAFDPGTGRWHLIAPIRANVLTTVPVSTWTGRQLFVTNGQPAKCALRRPVSAAALIQCAPTAGLYDPATDRWTYTPLPKPMRDLNLRGAVWTGREVILAGTDVYRLGMAVAAYDPADRRWSMITPTLPSDHPPVAGSLVATSDRVLLWSMWTRTKKISYNDYANYSGIDVLALDSAGRWRTVQARWPQHESVDGQMTVEGPLTYAGHQIFVPPGLIYCGVGRCSSGFLAAHLADARTLALTAIPGGPLNSPNGLDPGIWLWDGAAALVATAKSAGPLGSGEATLSALAAYDPATRQWHTLPVPPGTPAITARPLWANRQMFVLTQAGKLLTFRR
ncbi:MAG TPA: hypothetical protein VF834_17950 [Streptosporangiaceae bacterium]